MKIFLITYVTPTPDNYNAASALSFHIAKYRPANIELEIYSFNANNVPDNLLDVVRKELKAEIHIVPKNKWIDMLFKTHLVFLKNLLPYPFNYYNILPKKVVNEILEQSPDGIWVNGDFLSRVLSQFPSIRRVMTMPDCVCLYYQRLIDDEWCKLNKLRIFGYRLQAWKNKRMERGYPVDNVKFHLVGDADKEYLRSINPALDATFIYHPHYNYSEKKVIRFSNPKLRMLIAGKKNLYMYSASEKLIKMLCQNPVFSNKYELNFLGSGWEEDVKKLKGAGYDVHQKVFVDIYLDEIIKYDIQLTPISVGTGTKGKVLDALANGLLVIGTPYAMENIAVESGKSCLVYTNEKELINILNNIPKNISEHEKIAEEGRHKVLTEHNRNKVSNEFFYLFF